MTLRLRFIVWILTTVAILQSAAQATCICHTISVGLAGGRSVLTENISDYPDSRVSLIVSFADRGLVSQDPLHNTGAVGLISSSDRVVVTHYGIYWIDIAKRSGLLGGMWPIAPDGSGNANFRYIVGTNNWGPNFLLPGSNGTLNPDNTVDGFRVQILGDDGIDQPTAPLGKGTFVIHGSADQGSLFTTIQGHDHLYQVNGPMVQQGLLSNKDIIDSQSHKMKINFTLTYRFRDSNDTTTDYNGTSKQLRNRAEVSLFPVADPSSSIKLRILNVGGDFQGTAAPYPLLLQNYSNRNRQRIGCSSQTYAAFAVGSLCSNTSSNWIQNPWSLPTRLNAGDFTTFRQSGGSDKEITYLHPSGPFTQPARDSHVFDSINRAVAAEAQYFNGTNEIQTWTAGQVIQTAMDMQLIPF